jgi:purine-binding chemotaxis protein CheW
MDIAKIRKKAKEKEMRRSAVQKSEEAAEERGTPGLPSFPEEERDTASGETEEAEKWTDEEAQDRKLPFFKTAETGVDAAMASEAAEEPDEGERLSSKEAGNIIELLTFSLAGKEFAFMVSDVEEIIHYQGITFVPLLPDYVSGIMSLRGKIIPVVHLKARFALGQNPHRSSPNADPETNDRNEKILILSGPKGLIGAIIDKIREVVRFREDSVLAPPAHLTEEERRFIAGVVILEKRFISIVRFEEAMNIDAG